MYTNINFRTKKDLIASFKAGNQIGTHQPGGMFPSQKNGNICLEGPHYPEPHRWYASATIKDGIITKVK